MAEQGCCGAPGDGARSGEYETVNIVKTRNVCPMCEDYAKREASKPVVIMCCEGACLRGEIARQASNLVCHKLAPDKTVRLCLGGAFTKDTGQRGLVRNGQRVIALEGCFLECSSRMMKGAIPNLQPEIIIADGLYDFDRSLFGIDEMPESQIKIHAESVAKQVAARL
jgi:uncharacterized metal-binding protein